MCSAIHAACPAIRWDWMCLRDKKKQGSEKSTDFLSQKAAKLLFFFFPTSLPRENGNASRRESGLTLVTTARSHVSDPRKDAVCWESACRGRVRRRVSVMLMSDGCRRDTFRSDIKISRAASSANRVPVHYTCVICLSCGAKAARSDSDFFQSPIHSFGFLCFCNRGYGD